MPYVECDPRGLNPQPGRCERAAVKRYPTWLIAGARYERVMTLDELARASGFSATPPAR